VGEGREEVAYVERKVANRDSRKRGVAWGETKPCVVELRRTVLMREQRGQKTGKEKKEK